MPADRKKTKRSFIPQLLVVAAGRRDGGILGPLLLDDFLKQTAQVDAAMSGSGIGLRCIKDECIVKETWTD